MGIDSYFQSRRALDGLDLTGREVLELMGDLYFTPPANGLNTLNYTRFIDYIVMSAVLTIRAKLKKEQVSFASSLLACKDNLLTTNNTYNMSFSSFWVASSYEQATIFGCVYYILSFDKDFPQRHLLKIESLFKGNDLLYFNVFKEAVEKKKAAQKETLSEVPKEDLVAKNRDSVDNKRIILNDRRNSDFTRIVQAMHHADYFCHADKSAVSAKEVGQMLLSLFDVGTKWDSMLQKAYSRDNPLSTFDKLRDSAKDYWTKRSKIE